MYLPTQCLSLYCVGKESCVDGVFLSSSWVMDLPYPCHLNTEYSCCSVCNVRARH